MRWKGDGKNREKDICAIIVRVEFWETKNIRKFQHLYKSFRIL
jgi:hypothetical protein